MYKLSSCTLNLIVNWHGNRGQNDYIVWITKQKSSHELTGPNYIVQAPVDELALENSNLPLGRVKSGCDIMGRDCTWSELTCWNQFGFSYKVVYLGGICGYPPQQKAI